MTTRPLQDSAKLLIIAQRWAGDQDEMMALLSLIADLEPEFNNHADFLMFPRFDTKTRDFRAIDKLKTKFNVISSRSKRTQVGWPVGPNAMAMDAFKYCHERWNEGEFPYSAAFLIESDGLPLRPTWIKEILDEWLSYSDCLAMGHIDGNGYELERGSHMNGNMVFHPAIVNAFPDMAYGDVPEMGWDMKWWPAFKPYSAPSRLIFSDYRLNTPNNPLRGCSHLFEPRVHTHHRNQLVGENLNPCYLHGVKGLAGIKCVRDKFLVETKYQ